MGTEVLGVVTGTSVMNEARFLPSWQMAEVTGAVVVIDVIRAFTTAAYAFASGAHEIFLVSTLDEARQLKSERNALAMGEMGGRRPEGFDLSNSPVLASQVDLTGRTLVQRTSAGTQGVVAATSATRMWCASLVVATATANVVRASGLGAPAYVITGMFADDLVMTGDDDRATAELIERIRVGESPKSDETASFVASTLEAERTLALGGEDSHRDDVVFATQVDVFDFAMEVERVDGLFRLTPTHR
jgi:2-phosphosulfolactate phosphatase